MPVPRLLPWQVCFGYEIGGLEMAQQEFAGMFAMWGSRNCAWRRDSLFQHTFSCLCLLCAEASHPRSLYQAKLKCALIRACAYPLFGRVYCPPGDGPAVLVYDAGGTSLPGISVASIGLPNTTTFSAFYDRTDVPSLLLSGTLAPPPIFSQSTRSHVLFAGRQP